MRCAMQFAVHSSGAEFESVFCLQGAHLDGGECGGSIAVEVGSGDKNSNSKLVTQLWKEFLQQVRRGSARRRRLCSHRCLVLSASIA